MRRLARLGVIELLDPSLLAAGAFASVSSLFFRVTDRMAPLKVCACSLSTACDADAGFENNTFAKPTDK